MTNGKDLHQLRAHIHVHQYGSPPTWVPYKTLSGYGRGHQVIIDDIGEHLYETREFGTQKVAIEHARAEARTRIREKFPHVPDHEIQWQTIEESAPKARVGKTEET